MLEYNSQQGVRDMVTILQHLKKVRKTSSEFAIEIGICKSSMSKYIKGTRVPSLIVADKIMRASRYKIDVEGLLSVYEGYQYIRDETDGSDFL